MEYVIYFALTIGILVFVHEFGHFAAAKLSGMRAEIFALGFGKRLLGWNKISGFTFGELPKDFDGQGHTDYRICLLPLGGYVKIAGMIDESFDASFADKTPEPYEFRSKPTGKKIFVITAGVLMNLLLTILVFWGINFFQGKQITKTTTIGYVDSTSVASKWGFIANDSVVSVNGKKVNSWDDLYAEMYINNIGKNLKVKIYRNNELKDISIDRKLIPSQNETVTILPSGTKTALVDLVAGSPAEKAGFKKGDVLEKVNDKKVEKRDDATKVFEASKLKQVSVVVKRNNNIVNVIVTPNKDGKIGAYIGPIYAGPVELKKFGVFESFTYGIKDVVKITDLTFNMFGNVFTGKVEFKNAFGGPIKIAQYAAKSADNGLLSFLSFLALLSLSLAILNILPFPVLDGGHLIIIIIEGITKREIPIKVKIAIQNTGFVLLLILMAFIIYNDIISL